MLLPLPCRACRCLPSHRQPSLRPFVCVHVHGLALLRPYPRGSLPLPVDDVEAQPRFQHAGWSVSQERARMFNNEEVAKDELVARLKLKFAQTDIDRVKADVLPFVRNERELDLWTNSYFEQLADILQVE